MKNFFESGFLMSHEGSFPMGVKLSKSKKVYPKCVVAQRLGLLKCYHILLATPIIDNVSNNVVSTHVLNRFFFR